MTSRRLRPLVSASLFMVATASATIAMGNWPQWRGPMANAVAPPGDYPVKFSPSHNVMWQVEFDGVGTSTPAVWEDSIYLTLVANGNDAVASYDLDGNERWREELGPARPGKNRAATGSNPSPVTNGEHVVAYFKSGLVACFDTAGDKKWQVNLQDKYGEDTLWWDLGTSPVLTSAGVCIAVMQEGDSYLVTFDLETGDVVWKTKRQYERPRESDQAYTTPTVVEVDGKETIVTWGADHLTGHDATTGEQLWEQDGFNPEDKGMWRVIASATVADGTAYVPYGRGEFLAAVRLGGGEADESYLWRKRGVGADVPSPVVDDNKVYVLGDRGELTCLEANSGDIVWEARLPRSRDNYYSSPLLAGDKIYCLRQDGVLFVGSVADGFELLAENNLGDESVSTPVPVDGTLLVRTRTKLYRFGNTSAGSSGGQ